MELRLKLTLILPKERNLKKHGNLLIQVRPKVVCLTSKMLKLSSELLFHNTNGEAYVEPLFK
tara:strand:+ start:576 stop:761 length:186 start_codon:yes stop_codon:yes gene_type:complete